MWKGKTAKGRQGGSNIRRGEISHDSASFRPSARAFASWMDGHRKDIRNQQKEPSYVRLMDGFGSTDSMRRNMYSHAHPSSRLTRLSGVCIWPSISGREQTPVTSCVVDFRYQSLLPAKTGSERSEFLSVPAGSVEQESCEYEACLKTKRKGAVPRSWVRPEGKLEYK